MKHLLLLLLLAGTLSASPISGGSCGTGGTLEEFLALVPGSCTTSNGWYFTTAYYDLSEPLLPPPSEVMIALEAIDANTLSVRAIGNSSVTGLTIRVQFLKQLAPTYPFMEVYDLSTTPGSVGIYAVSGRVVLPAGIPGLGFPGMIGYMQTSSVGSFNGGQTITFVEGIVPEPATNILLGTSLALLAVVHRFRKAH